MVHLLPHFEHLASPFAQFVELVTASNDKSVMVPEILREIGRLDAKDLARDTSGTRYTAAFLTELAERAPKAVLESLSVLFPLLDGESYTMRNAILSVMGSIVARILVTDRSEHGLQTRDQFLDILQQRLYDTSAYVRSRALQVWATLTAENAIPLARRPKLMAEVAGRLEDKSSQVRKQALQLVTALLVNNPYGPQLSLPELRDQLADAKAKLAALTNDDADDHADDKRVPQQQQQEEEEEEKEKGDDEEDEPQTPDTSVVESEATEAEPMDTEPMDAEPTVESDTNAVAVAEQRVRVAYYRDAVLFAEQIEHVITVACQLLGSKNISDIAEAVNFFVACEKFGVQGAAVGVRKMLALVWAKETAAKEALLAAYDELYLQPAKDAGKARSAIIARNLISLTAGCNLGDLTSFEELLRTLMATDRIDASVVDVLWDVFSKRIPNVTDEQSRGALLILGMVAKASPEIVKENISLLVAESLGPRAATDLLLVRHACVALQSLCTPPTTAAAASTAEPERLAESHSLFGKLLQAVTTPAVLEAAAPAPHWHAAVEQVINTVYRLAEHPDSICADLLARLAAPCFGADAPASGSALPLERLLFAVGHTALKQLVHLDYIETELKRRHQLQDEKNEKLKANTKTKKKQAAGEEDDDDMGVGGATAEDEEAEMMHRIAERELVLGDTLLAQYVPVVLAVCQHLDQYQSDRGLMTAATLTLCKFMCTSSVFCEEHLPLLFTIMRDSKVAAIRTNCMIALGDLAFRFPNVLEPWTSHLYGRLRDTDTRVRKTALMVLTHLILNDMVKVKGQISEMAVCLEDSESRIR